MKIGIIGLPYSGKTALFEAVTGAHGAAADHKGIVHMATVTVPDDRLDYLATVCSPGKVTHAHIDFVDVVGVTADEDRERAVNALSPLRDADGLVHVVRFFEWAGTPPHPSGTLDPGRDAAEIETELIITDLVIVERRINKLEKQIHKPTSHQDQDKKELSLMRHIKEALDEGKRVGTLDLSPDESFMLRSFQLLSDKPILPVLNVHEDELDSDATRAAAEALGPETVLISAKIEKEISELDPEERQEFIEGLGLGESASKRVIRACYEQLGLRSFFTGTAPGDELRAWTIRAGDSALTAAGKIHTDMARGFIRAEVIPYEDVRTAGSIKEARAQNKMRLEGKDYAVQDGDIIRFRFKV